MAGQSISITQGPTTLTATAVQPAREALDLQGLSGTRFDFNLRSIYIAGSSFSATVSIQTSMTNDDNPQNWHSLVAFSAVTAANAVQVTSVTAEVLRYVRWSVSISGTTPSFTFELLGMVW